MAERPNAIKRDGHIEFSPQKQKVVPEPPNHKPSSRRITFSRPIEEVRTVSKALFDTFDEKPGVVGDKCFSLVLSEILVEEG